MDVQPPHCAGQIQGLLHHGPSVQTFRACRHEQSAKQQQEQASTNLVPNNGSTESSIQRDHKRKKFKMAEAWAGKNGNETLVLTGTRLKSMNHEFGQHYQGCLFNG